MLPQLYPDKTTWRAASERIYSRARPLLDSSDPVRMSVGFFLFGLSEAARGARSYGK